MDIPHETRTLRRIDLARDPRHNGPALVDLPLPVRPESSHEYWIDFGFRALLDAFTFGCVVVGAIFLAFALYNAFCDPFCYINIFVIGVISYLVILFIAFLLSYFFGDLAGRFNGTVSESNARYNRSNPEVHRDLQILRRPSASTAANNFINESRYADIVAQGLQNVRRVSGTGESFALEAEPQNTRRMTQAIDQQRQLNNIPCTGCPYCEPLGTGSTIPPDGLLSTTTKEENRICEDIEENRKPDCNDNDWFNRQLARSPMAPSNFAPCLPVGERMRMNALRCTPTATTTTESVAEAATGNSNCQRLLSRPSTQQWSHATAVTTSQRPTSCHQPTAICQQPTTSYQTRTCQQTTTCRKHNICRSRPDARQRQLSPQTYSAGTRQNSNSRQGRCLSNNSNSNSNDSSRNSPPGPCTWNSACAPEHVFIRTDGYD